MFRRDEGDGNPHDVVLEKLLAAGVMFRCRANRETGVEFFGTVDFFRNSRMFKDVCNRVPRRFWK